MSNLESDCSDYLPSRLDSLPNITSDFTYYLSCIMHHSSQITVLGTMLTWHPSTEILSRLSGCIYIILIPFLDSGKALCRGKLSEGESKIIVVGFFLWGMVYYYFVLFTYLLNFARTRSVSRVYGIPFILEPWKMYQIGATSRSRLRRWMTDWWWPIFNALLNV